MFFWAACVFPSYLRLASPWGSERRCVTAPGARRPGEEWVLVQEPVCICARPTDSATGPLWSPGIRVVLTSVLQEHEIHAPIGPSTFSALVSPVAYTCDCVRGRSHFFSAVLRVQKPRLNATQPPSHSVCMILHVMSQLSPLI